MGAVLARDLRRAGAIGMYVTSTTAWWMAAVFTITMTMEILVHVLKTWEQKKEFCNL